jgi:hypothetical protein
MLMFGWTIGLLPLFGWSVTPSDGLQPGGCGSVDIWIPPELGMGESAQSEHAE